jgi:hypothetical protein
MANEIPFGKQFHRAKSTYSPPIRSSSLTSFKQHRCKDNQVYSDYPWILQSEEKRLTQQKHLEERQKVCLNSLFQISNILPIYFRQLSTTSHPTKL